MLAVAWEKQAEGNAQWGLAGGTSGGIGAGGIFAPWIRALHQRSGAPEYIGWQVAVKDRLNAVKNPYAHLKLPDITIEKVQGVADAVGPDPLPRVVPVVRRCVRDGRRRTRPAQDALKPAAWVLGHAMRRELGQFPGRDTVRPQAGVDCAHALYKHAGITNPREQIDVAELYVPF